MRLLERKRIYLDCCKPSNLAPDLEVRNIKDIPVEFLREKGIKGLVFDVDNTLCRRFGKEVHPLLSRSFHELTENFKSCILTNSTPERKKEVEEYFKLPVVQTDVRKPYGFAFSEACNLIGYRPYETAMIGDRLLTDIAGANRWGMYTIKVYPVSRFSEPPHHTAARMFESVWLRVLREEGHAEKTYLHLAK